MRCAFIIKILLCLKLIFAFKNLCEAVPVEPIQSSVNNSSNNTIAPPSNQNQTDSNNTVVVVPVNNTAIPPNNQNQSGSNSSTNATTNAVNGTKIDPTSTNSTRKGTKFVSLRCGIGARWNSLAQVCTPTNDEEGGSDESSEEIPPLTVQERGAQDSEELISEELIKWQIITVMCGIGYRYLKKEKICRPIEWEGRETLEHKKMDKQSQVLMDQIFVKTTAVEH